MTHFYVVKRPPVDGNEYAEKVGPRGVDYWAPSRAEAFRFPTIAAAAAVLVASTRDKVEALTIARVDEAPGVPQFTVLEHGEASDLRIVRYALRYGKVGSCTAYATTDRGTLWREDLRMAHLFETEGEASYNLMRGNSPESVGTGVRVVRVAVGTSAPTLTETTI